MRVDEERARQDLRLAALLAAVFALPSFAARAAIAYGSAATHLGNLVALGPQALLFLFLIDTRTRALASETRGRLARDLLGACALAALLVGAGLGMSALAGAFAQVKTLAPSAAALPPPPLLFLPLVAASALAVGFREEALYRVLLPDLLASGGLSRGASVAGPLALFAAGHAWLGWAGVASALILGAILQIARERGASLRRLSLAHALYDFAAMLGAAYGAF